MEASHHDTCPPSSTECSDNCCPPPSSSLLDDPEEMAHFRSIVGSFLNYRVDSLREVSRIERGFSAMKPANVSLLKFPFNNRIEKLKQSVESNAIFLDTVVEQHRDDTLSIDPKTKRKFIADSLLKSRDVSKVRSTLRSIVRDWTTEGKAERDSCYLPVMNEFKKHFPSNRDAKGKRIRVLFPGCGLARIVFDFACAGYGAQGNEFSYHMLLTSDFILNSVSHPNQFTVQPYIHSFSNAFTEADPFRSFLFPDVCPADELNVEENDDFSMIAGEFVEIYKQQTNAWDSVCTIFFIDTAHDIVEYIRTIYTCLAPGGVWINFGPLLYHYADNQSQISIELSWEELQHVIIQIGFTLTIHPNVSTYYATDPHDTMMKVLYNCIFFTAIKPLSN